MRKKIKIAIDVRKKKLFFPRNCSKALSLCKAMCCRVFGVSILKDEKKKGMYDIDLLCGLNNKKCNKSFIDCTSQKFWLKRHKDGRCIYLDNKNKCSIYKDRPQVCKAFDCKGGWEFLTAVSSKKSKALLKSIRERISNEKLKDTTQILLNPLARLKSIICLENQPEIIFIIEETGNCTPIVIKHSFINSGLREKDVVFLLKLFRGDTFKKIYQEFNKYKNRILSKEELNKIILLLKHYNVILFKTSFKSRR